MKHRNSSMDVLRSLAIVMVVDCHVAGVFASPSIRAIFGQGGKGVDLFFVLSGWLVGHQLLSELSERSAIDVKRFWMRRWVRTLPAHYAVLLGTYVQQILKTRQIQLDWSFLFLINRNFRTCLISE